MDLFQGPGESCPKTSPLPATSRLRDFEPWITLRAMSQSEINESEWSKPQNWSLYAYRSRADNRFFVPKRRGFGVTINFGHKSALLYILGFTALILSPLIIALVGIAVKGKL